MIDVINPLARGFYTVKDAARLIEVGSALRIKGWLNGYAQRDIGPLLYRDYTPIAGKQELSFLDLMEVRFVEHFRSHNVKVTTLRDALERARRIFGDDKPLLKKGIVFMPTEDRRQVFVEEVLRAAAEKTGDKVLWDMTTGQMEFLTLIEERLTRGLTFDPETQLTSTWVPRPTQYPSILVDPKVAYGQPHVPGGVPTEVLHRSWLAEDQDVPAVADWYNVPFREVENAVGFEELLRNNVRRAQAA